eukprot:12582498-Alexandrium_andersonii.AAC.1
MTPKASSTRWRGQGGSTARKRTNRNNGDDSGSRMVSRAVCAGKTSWSMPSLSTSAQSLAPA